jgi:hypothetical protein
VHAVIAASHCESENLYPSSDIGPFSQLMVETKTAPFGQPEAGVNVSKVNAWNPASAQLAGMVIPTVFGFAVTIHCP